MKKDVIKIGDATITTEAVAQLAGSIALECFGIVGMAAISMKDGLMRLIIKEPLTRGIEISVEDSQITVIYHVIVAYGVNIAAVSENLIENVKYKLESFTGMQVKHISVIVEGVKPID